MATPPPNSSLSVSTAPWPGLAWTWADAATAKAGVFTPSRAAERSYERTPCSLSVQISQVLTSNRPQDAEDILRTYADAITPWAQQSAANMLDGVARGNLDQFRRIADRMGLDMRMFLAGDPIGQTVAQRIEANTTLIKSLPLEAAMRAGALAHEGLISGMRAEDMAAELASIGGTTMSRARCIALTEVSKASTALTQARAGSVGSDGYIWRSVRDGATRPSHRAMEGKFVSWDSPPTLDGMTGHAGEFPYCRCYPEPVIPKGDDTRKTVAGSSLPTQEQEKGSGEQKLYTQWEKSQGAEVVRHVPGAPLYNVERAQLDMGKLSAYALDPDHPRGGDKARVFASALGLGPQDAGWLRDQVMQQLPTVSALVKPGTEYGQRFDALVPVTGRNGRTVAVKTVWQYDYTDGGIHTAPRLITMYVDK